MADINLTITIPNDKVGFMYWTSMR